MEKNMKNMNMTSYLRRHKSEWYNPALETEKRDANKKVISEGKVIFTELKRYTIKAAEEPAEKAT